MEDQDAARLAGHIVREAFGDIAGKVASALLTHGRMAHGGLLHHTKTPLAISHLIRSSLLILLHHNLIYYSLQSGAKNDEAYYEMNVREVLMRLRWGRILDITETEFGKEGKEVVECILTHGKLDLPSILSILATRFSDPTKGIYLDPTSSEPFKSTYTSVILRLLTTSHILPTTPHLHVSPYTQLAASRRRKTQMVASSHGTKSKTLLSVKEQNEIITDSKEEVRKERLAERAMEKGLIVAYGGAAAAGGSNNKKRKREGEEMRRVDPTCLLRINYDVYNVKFRNQLFVQAAQERWNKPTSNVVKAFLKASIASQTYVRQVTTEIVSVHSIVSHLSEDEKDSLSYGFGSKTIASRSKVPELLSAYSAILAGEDNKAMSFKATSEGIFLKREEVGGGGGMTGAASYTVPIERVCARLKLGVLEGMVEEMFGRNAVRIFRVIGYEIKALEITLHQHTMLPKEKVQEHLATLTKHGYVSIQQIPRGNDRTPSRSIFLYYINLPTCYAQLLSTLYKILGNLAQRRQFEMSKCVGLLERANRTDVRQGEAELSERDQGDLKELKRKLDEIALAELRTETSVFVLRDLPGDPPGSTFNDPYQV